jgi:hypothetical protein
MTLIRRLRRARSGHSNVTFCDACGQVCDGTCRAKSVRGRAELSALMLRRP